jgi:hypothetical protein
MHSIERSCRNESEYYIRCIRMSLYELEGMETENILLLHIYNVANNIM